MTSDSTQRDNWAAYQERMRRSHAAMPGGDDGDPVDSGLDAMAVIERCWTLKPKRMQSHPTRGGKILAYAGQW